MSAAEVYQLPGAVQQRAGDALAALIEVYALDAARDLARRERDPLPKGLYSLREAAEWLSVSADKVKSWVDEGWLPAVSPPDGTRRVAVRREDLERFRDQWGQR